MIDECTFVVILDFVSGLISAGSIGEVPILLVKPQAYMNYSGESVSFSFYANSVGLIVSVFGYVCGNFA